jgi:hypothetical protein
MRKLDVKEIHGFSASLGLKLLKPAFLKVSRLPGRGAVENGKKTKRQAAA